MKEISPPNVNLKRLYETETSAPEPILFIISPGADPSQELEELAKSTIGLEKYHQVWPEQFQNTVSYILSQPTLRAD